MKRSSEDEQNDASPDERIEAMMGGFLVQYRRVFWGIGILIAALLVIGLVLVFK